jgi:hypothetical protein
MISTRDLSQLPDIPGFRRLTRSLAMLDAILSPEWEDRYYSFDARWADGEMMASMRNGSGDQWFALLTKAGAALHGLAHEYPTFRPDSPWPGIFDALPRAFHANFLNEPAFDTANSTFCIWRGARDDGWQCGPIDFPPGEDPDGSAWLLAILAGQPEQYVQFAAEYYERDLDLADVAAVYQHTALNKALVKRLNPEVSLASLAEDIKEIGYPDAG